jgi:hypothetical protein
MNQTGISHPSKLDLVTRGDDGFRLVLVEDRSLSEDDAAALQEKLNNYLGFAIDGGLLAQYPESQGEKVSIRIDLYAEPVPFILDFVRQYRAAIAPYGVAVELTVNGEAVS